ncbi:MAG: hypothetical protein K6E13_09620 [Lachnospiraceae bacterium]|nr:hypothetical protein [Lachnospiraceae bacterium]
MKNKISLAILCALVLTATACGTTESTKEAVETEAESTETATEIASTEAESTETATEIASTEVESTEESAAVSDLADGCYETYLLAEPSEFAEQYVSSIEFKDSSVVIDASFFQIENNDWDNRIGVDKNVYTIVLDENTQFTASGGDADPEQMTREEFESYLKDLINSGLGLEIKIENGVATVMDIYS